MISNIWDIAGAIIISFGGAGAILIGLASWIGKIWANRLYEKQKHQFDKELETYKSNIEKELSVFKKKVLGIRCQSLSCSNLVKLI